MGAKETHSDRHKMQLEYMAVTRHIVPECNISHSQDEIN